MPDGMDKIEHLVIVTMENRSFDHYLGGLTAEGRADVEGLPDPPLALPDAAGSPVPAWDMDGLFRGYADSPHGWDDAHGSWDGGRCDGFVRQYEKDGGTPINIPVGHYTRRTLPVAYALADRFTVCDHWFCSVLSSTWPNRKYLLSGRRDDDDDTQTLPPFPGFGTTPFPDVLEDARDPATGERLTWRSYFCDAPFLAFWYRFAAFHALSHFHRIDRFAEDCRADRLPTVSLIDPPFSLADDHPSHDVRLGQKFLGLVVDALTTSEAWAKTALVILYDENGGFADHVPPPRSFEAASGAGPVLDDPLGFRVPALVVSPYARRGGVSKAAYDHTSVMKSIAVRWGVDFDPAVFGPRWALAPDIWADCFDFNQDPLPMGLYTPPAFPALTWEAGVHDLLVGPVGYLEGLLERAFVLPGLKALDGRAQVFDGLAALERQVAALRRML
jgi:phospholipase C